VQEGHVDRGRDLAQLVSCAARSGDVPGGQLDLDVRTEQSRSGDRSFGLVEDAPYGGLRRIDASLRQPQQRETRLRLPSPPARQPVRVLGLRQATQQPHQLGLLVVREAGRGVPRELLAGSPGLVHGVPPVAVQLHDLSPVGQALPAVRHEVGLRVTPVTECRRPLPRPAQLEDLLACLDGGAVHDADDDGGHLRGRDRNDHFVQRRHRLRTSAQGDQGLSAPERAQCQHVRIVESRADARHLREDGERAGGVTGLEEPQARRHEEEAALGAVAGLVHELLCPRQPAAAAGRLPPKEGAEAQPEGAARRPLRPALSKSLGMGLRPDLEALLLPADEVGGHRELLEVVHPEGCLLLRR
jgi:hypothetical protein